MSRYLLDTNVVSELVQPRPNPRVTGWLDDNESDLAISVLTIAELRKGVVVCSSPRRQAALDRWIDRDLKPRFADRILPIDLSIAERWGWVSGIATRRGRTLPVIDSFLAATAIHHGLTLVTRNVSDFEPSGVSLFNPWDLV